MCFAQNAFQNDAFAICDPPVVAVPTQGRKSFGGTHNPFHHAFVRSLNEAPKEAFEETQERFGAGARNVQSLFEKAFDAFDASEAIALALTPKSRTAARMGAALEDPPSDSVSAAAEMGATLDDES